MFLASGADDFRLTSGGGSSATTNLQAIGNSTVPILAGVTFTSGAFQTTGGKRIVVTCATDQAGNLSVEQSPDNVNYLGTREIKLKPNELNAFEVDVVSPFARIRLENGSSNQTFLRLYWYLSST